jgi:hypothetical protein
MGILAALSILIIFLMGGAAAALEDPDAMMVIAGLGTVFAFVAAIVALPNLIAGYGLLKFRQWGRITALILSFLNLAAFPLGTALGIYGIYVLFHGETKLLFDGTLGTPSSQQPA